MDNSTNTSIENPEPKNGYDYPVYGLDNGTFYYLHIPAFCCICCSFCCVVIALVLSFRQGDYRKFFSWTKSERFVVYLAICDGGFNVVHSTDHMYYIITKYHVRPEQLCKLNAFFQVEFITAQIFMVNIVAINAFAIMVFKRNVNFGKYDWRLLVWTFGLPFLCATANVVTGQLGPNGWACFFDAVRGDTAKLFVTTIPLLIILLMNSVMYAVTWKRIRQETKSLQQTLHTNNITNRSHRAARNMSLFVAAFFIQWGPLAFFGIWPLIDENVPLALFHFVTIAGNIGGCLNLCVYIIMRRRNLRDKRRTYQDRQQADTHEMKTVSSGTGCALNVKTLNSQVVE